MLGGAPELCDQFKPLVSGLRNITGREKLTIIDRCNLTALLEPGTNQIDKSSILFYSLFLQVKKQLLNSLLITRSK